MKIIDARGTEKMPCELCGTTGKDLRPYGPDNEWICFACGMKNEAAARAKFAEMMSGSFACLHVTGE